MSQKYVKMTNTSNWDKNLDLMYCVQFTSVQHLTAPVTSFHNEVYIAALFCLFGLIRLPNQGIKGYSD